jgi:2-C-methyl-D-erythritol 4-phosphate cytidylyltransferase
MEGTDKIWAELDGAPVIAASVRLFTSLEVITHLVIVAPREHHDVLRALAGQARQCVRIVEGGARRQDSVACGIAAVPGADWYLVHDGARPFATAALGMRVLEAAREHGAAVPGIPVHDAIKHVNEQGRVVTSVDRASLRAVQTPQAFAGALLRRAHATVRNTVSDDGAIVEAVGEAVYVVEGDEQNLKVTTILDLEFARLLAARRRGGAE